MNPTAISTFALVLALGAIGVASGAQAAVLTGSLSGWETTVGTWGETTNLGAADGTSITGFTTVDGVLVSVNDQVHSIGDGWATWSGGYTGQVLADYSSLSVSYTLGSGVKGFGMFIEPDPFSVIDITLTTSDGSTLTQAVNGNGGAEFFGWTGGGITSFTVTSTSDFAVGDFFSARVPEPATWAMMLLGIG
ncbi:MAG TPA: PEP-CTERM sorting domain-containing protein, partial [Caulobacteraceae bacterium]